MNQFTLTFFIVTISVFALTVLSERILIPILRARKLGQKILEIGPRWHKNKEGTPIMGGIGFILAILLVMAGFFIYRSIAGDAERYLPLSLTLAYAVANGAIGFVDDYCKLIKKQNEGLTSKQKLLLQLVICAAYLCVLGYTGNLSTALSVPFTNLQLELGWLFYPVAVVLLTGILNGANFTDGVDGLASSVSLVIGAFFAVWAFSVQDEQLSLLAGGLIGATLGFLVYNAHPAKIFMGDTGSLFFGALIMGTLVQTRQLLLGILICGVFVIEMLSSFLQTFYFKISHGKRLFRMAPIHHHFEKGGWSEWKVVIVFSAVELIFCAIAFAAIRMQTGW